MKQFRHVVFPVLLISVYVLFENSQKQLNLQLPTEPRPAAGSEDHPYARDYYDWMRLRNPVTGDIPRNIRTRELEFAARLPTTSSPEAAARGRLLKGGGATVWQDNGPVNVGGRTRALAIDADDEDIILAGGVSGGMWRSEDNGASWTKTTTFAQLHSVTCIAQDTRPGKRHIWYYGTGELRGNSANGGRAFYYGDGIFKSTDGGRSWAILPSTSTNAPQARDQSFDIVWDIITDSSNNVEDEVYAATYDRIFRSTNGGSTWQAVHGQPSSLTGYADLAITSQGVVYATLGFYNKMPGTSGIWRSGDGIRWTEITPSGWPSIYRRIVIGIAPSNEDIVYFLAETPGSGQYDHSFWKYTYLSGNGGGANGRWEDRSKNILVKSQGSYNMAIGVSPEDENSILMGGVLLKLSTDAYATPNNVLAIVGIHVDQHIVVFRRSNSKAVVVGNDGGVARNEDLTTIPQQWTNISNGYKTSQFYTVAVDHIVAGNEVIVGGTQDNGTYFTNSADPQVGWNRISGGDGAYCAMIDGKSICYTSTQSGNNITRYELNEDGSTGRFANVTPAGISNTLFINPFVLDPNNNAIMYVLADKRVWRNDDLNGIAWFNGGPTQKNWVNMSNSEPPDNAFLTTLAVSISPPNRLYYGSYSGKIYRIDNANAGDPPATEISKPNLPAGYPSCIAIDPRDADKLLLVYSNYGIPSLFYSANAGDTWTDVSGNLEEFPDGSGTGPSVRWAEILPLGSQALYFVGTSTGLYSTMKLEGSSTPWEQEGAKTIGNVVVDMLDSRVADGLIVAATHGNGIYRAYFSESVPVELTEFTARRVDKGFEVRLTWQTVSESDNFGFEVERRIESSDTWQKIGFLAGQGTTTELHQYSFRDDVRSLIASQTGSAFYRLKQIDMDGSLVYSDEIDISLAFQPDNFVLYQNFPNPFNPSTRISYEIKEKSNVALEIYNATGQRVDLLVKQVQNAGYYEIDWSPGSNHLASTVYFCRLLTTPVSAGDSFSQVQKMVALK